MSVYPYSFSWTNGSYKNSINSLTNAFNIGGVRNAVFAFVIADNNDLDNQLNDILSFVSLGGKLKISFGGAAGKLIDESITDSTQLYNAYTSILYKTGCYYIDFDIEGNNVGKWDVDTRRNNVLVKLQQNFPNLRISYTLASDQNGMSNDSVNILKNAINSGVQIDLVNVMLMDNNWQDSAAASIQGVRSVYSQLQMLYPNKNSSQLNQMISACYMIGKNDDNSFFSLDNAKTVVDYFNSIGGIGGISYWALQRDTVGSSDYNISSLYNNNDFDFYNVFNKMIVTPQPIPQPIPQPTPSGKVTVGDIILGNTVVADPKQNWIKVDNITMGESASFGYKTVKTSDIGGLLDKLTTDPKGNVVNYNWITKIAYIKTNYNTKTKNDTKLNKNFTVFIKKT